MKAIILSAGVGKRLSEVTRHKPKALIPIGGRTLLSRYFDALASVGVSQATIVVGYKQEMIREAFESCNQEVDVRFRVNEDYRRGSIGSLWTARHDFDDDTILMDADVLFHPDILKRLVRSTYTNVLLMDDTVVQQSEECMVVVRGDRVVALTKHMPSEFDIAGEGVGFLKVDKTDAPRLLLSIEQCLQQGQRDMEYEDALEHFFREVLVGYEKIGGLPWIEIDFLEDLVRAENEVLPQIEKASLSVG